MIVLFFKMKHFHGEGKRRLDRSRRKLKDSIKEKIVEDRWRNVMNAVTNI